MKAFSPNKTSFHVKMFDYNSKLEEFQVRYDIHITGRVIEKLS